MAAPMQRHRSNASMVSAMHRPLSRASTTSANSPAPEFMPQEQKYIHTGYVPTAEDQAIMHYMATQPPQHIDPMLQQNLQYQQAMQYSRPQTPLDGQYMVPSVPYGPPMHMGIPSHLAAMEPEDRRRKSSAATATNDKELRELLVKNESRALKDVAQEVIQKERTPQAEKTKQLFAMLWLRKVCKAAKTSVPRNRVYSHYATRCGTERVVPLNPASFGKLVRVIFPGIQTRRLGVRGESKYHYVDLCLVDDESDQPQALNRSTSFIADGSEARRSASVNPQIDFSSIPHLPADTSAFPTNDSPSEMQPPPQPETRGPPSKGKIFAYPDTRGMTSDNESAIMYEQHLRFPPREETPFQENEPIALPNIHPYCPPKTDPDTAEALTALYRTHCTSLIDCVRFCKEKQFFRLFTSFHGTLTVPVQKLLAHPNLAPWIRECDWLMYQKMVRFVSRLTLQAAPPVVITILNNISANLHSHISKTFASHPQHVLDAKLKPAAIFAGLLHRLIRVNAAAHAAANLLTIDQNREQMWQEWVTMVNPKRVMESELPGCGYEEVYKIMTVDIRGLLEPLISPPFPDNPMFTYDNQAYGNAQTGFQNVFQNINVQPSEQTSQLSAENVLDRWSAFLNELPSRFPNASARTILHCISSVGTAALRDITILGGASYQIWWVMKIFVDEMAHWLAAMGGFLDHTPLDSTKSRSGSEYQSPVLQQNGDARSGSAASGSGSRMSSMEADFNNTSQNLNSSLGNSASGGAQMTRAPSSQSMHSAYNNTFDMNSSNSNQGRSQQPSMQQQMQQQQYMLAMQQQQQMNDQQSLQLQTQNMPLQDSQTTDIDDSGIGMSLMDDDLTMAKFGLTGAHVAQDLVAGDLGVDVL